MLPYACSNTMPTRANAVPTRANAKTEMESGGQLLIVLGIPKCITLYFFEHLASKGKWKSFSDYSQLDNASIGVILSVAKR